MNDSQTNKTLALSGIFQAAALVKQLAIQGVCDNAAFNCSIYSLLQIDAKSVIDVYKSPEQLTLGLETLINFFNYKTPREPEIARYALSLIHLERILVKNPDMLEMIKIGIERAKDQANLFSLTHENVMANLAGLYTDTLSNFNFRIYITGNPNYLNNTNITNKIRTLLLAGIRSCVLWRQLGGSRLNLVFSKKTTRQAIAHILQSLQEPVIV